MVVDVMAGGGSFPRNIIQHTVRKKSKRIADSLLFYIVSEVAHSENTLNKCQDLDYTSVE